MPTCPECAVGFEYSMEETRLREKISSTFQAGPVPASPLCPDCRMQRLMAFRNERYLYGRTCDKTGQKIIAVYPPKTPFPVYARSVWWGDSWDPLAYGRDFDFNRPFFEQFAELQKAVPRPSLNAVNCDNSDYCNFGIDARNCYLSHNSYRSEDLMYCYWMLECKDCADCSYCFRSERCFDCTDCNHSYGCIGCTLSHNCSDSYYLYDCRGCRNCFGCVGLRQQEYCMFNEPLGKEAYLKRLAQFALGSPQQLKAVKQRVEALKMQKPHLYSVQEKTEDCTGDYIFESKNCLNCYQIYRSQDCVNVQDAETKDALDSYHPGWSQGVYLSYSPVRQQNTAFCVQCWDGSDNFYDDNCQSCSHCFGSIGLRHKQYCVLNKPYSREAYEALLPDIVSHMKKTGEWGRFFPMALSPFAYNETVAQESFPLTREQVTHKGWRWRDDLPFTQGKETIAPDAIPESIEQTDDSILNEVLACSACRRNYKLIKQELRFYRQMKVGVPRQCPECRHKERMDLRNPRKLYHRICSKCQTPIQSTYAPASEEAGLPAGRQVYCQACYLQAVY